MDAALAMCPNSLRQHCLINMETGGWLVCELTDMLDILTVYELFDGELII